MRYIISTLHCFSVKLHIIADHTQFSLKPERSNIHISDNISATMVKSCNTLAEIKQEILVAGDKLIVIDFFADWCPPCRIMSPEFEKLALEEKDVVFLEVNIAVNPEAADRFYINALPTFIFIKDGAMVGEVLGAKVDKLKETINKNK